jgi:hypothetical protein
MTHCNWLVKGESQGMDEQQTVQIDTVSNGAGLEPWSSIATIVVAVIGPALNQSRPVLSSARLTIAAGDELRHPPPLAVSPRPNTQSTRYMCCALDAWQFQT